MSSRIKTILKILQMLDGWFEAGIIDLTEEEYNYEPPKGLNDVKRELVHMTEHLHNNIRKLVGGEEVDYFKRPENPSFEEALTAYRKEKDHAYEIIAKLKDEDLDTVVGVPPKQMSKLEHIFRIVGHNLWTTGNLRYLRSMRLALLGEEWKDWKTNWGSVLKERREWFNKLMENTF